MNIKSKKTHQTSYLHDHRTADVDQKVEAVLVGKQRIPYPQHVRQRKLLREQQRYPSEAVVLRLQVQLLKLEPHVQVVVLQLREHPRHHGIDAAVRFIQAFDEEISYFRH